MNWIVRIYLWVAVLNLVCDLTIAFMQLLGFDFSFLLDGKDMKDLDDIDMDKANLIRTTSRFVPLLHLYTLALSASTITIVLKGGPKNKK